jgi:drug/metabolite transporter (DMT)-like permease
MILYCGGLVIVYRYWDVSTAYPMVRSLPLLLVAAITGVFGIGSPLNIFAVIGMIMVFSGCLCMPIKDWQSFRWRDYFKLKMVFVLICASGTAGYTIFDSLALAAVGEVYDPQGVSQVVKSLSYYSVREVFLGSILISGSLVIPGQRRHYAEIWRQCRWLPMVAGCLASISYVLVLISMNFVNNVSYIQVFRQMGLLFAVAAGVFILKERVSWLKIAGLLLIICGLCISVIK